MADLNSNLTDEELVASVQRADKAGNNILNYVVGSGDETTAVQAWLDSGNNLVGADIEVSVSSSLIKDITSNFSIEGKGLRLTSIAGAIQNNGLLALTITSNIDRFTVSDLVVDCTNTFAEGLKLRSDAGTIGADVVKVQGNKCSNIISDSQTVFAVGITIDMRSETLDVSGNIIDSVTRLQTNPGTIASRGLYLSRIDNGVVNIYNNKISNILSIESSKTDADGMAIYSTSKNTIPAVHQNVAINVYGNKLDQCEGRFIKLQTSNAVVYSNKMKNENNEINTNLIGIDFQWGGGIAYDNNFIIDNITGATGHCLAVNFAIAASSEHEGALECTYLAHDNTMTVNVPWYAFAGGSGGDGVNVTYSLHNNLIHNLEDTYAQLGFFARFSFSVTDGGLLWDMQDNTFQLGHGDQMALFYTSTDSIQDEAWMTTNGHRQHFKFKNNSNIPQYYQDTSYCSTYLYRNIIPHFKNFEFSNNNVDEGDNKIAGFNINTWISNNSNFYYTDDGATGGIINAPAGYEQNVYIEAIGRTRRLTKLDGSGMVMRTWNTGSWTEYTGIAL